MHTTRWSGVLATAALVGLTALAAPTGLQAQEEQEVEYVSASAEMAAYANPHEALTENAEHFSSFLQFVQAADMEDMFQADEARTFFIPTNDAMGVFETPDLKNQARANEQIRRIVQNHIVTDEALTAAELAKKDHVNTMQRQVADEVQPQAYEIKVKTDGDGKLVLDDDVRVVQTDIRAGSAIIHVIDAPLTERRLEPRKTPFEDTP